MPRKKSEDVKKDKNDEITLSDTVTEPEVQEKQEQTGDGNGNLSLSDMENKPEESTPPEAPKGDNGGVTYKIGDAGYEEMMRRDALAQARREKNAQRFWIPSGEEAVIVFLDNPEFYTAEHEINVNGNWTQRAYLTCIDDLAPCSVCAGGVKNYYLAYGSIYDTRTYTKRGSDEKIRKGKSLFGAKKATMFRIKDLVKQYGDLRGLAFRVKRYPGDKEPKVGSNFEYLGKVDLEKEFGKGEDIIAYDYKKILAHPTDEELKMYGFAPQVAGSLADLKKDAEVDESLSFL